MTEFNLFSSSDENSFILKGQDFITQVSEFISKSTMTNPRWSECIATSMLSIVMGPKRYISNIKGKLSLNVWYLCIGPSGLAMKTLPMKSYLFPIISKIGEQEHLILPNRFSVEGFIKYFPDHGSGIIIRDEFTGLLKESGKDYLTDVLEFLSELYDGTVQKRATVTNKVNEIKHCYVNLITATTPYLYKVMRPEFYTQGTGNRILSELFSDKNLSEERIDSETFFQGPNYENKRDGFIKEVSDILEQIRDCNVRHFFPDEEAGKLWADFEYECRMTALKHYRSNMYDLHYSYLARSAEMALKLSALYTISRKWDRVIIEDAPQMDMVSVQDMKRAIDKSRHHYQQFCIMLDQWRARPEMVVAKTLDEQANFIFDTLHTHQEGLSWTELRKLIRWDTYTWREVLKFLFETEKVIIIKGQSNTQGGRKPVIFYENNQNNKVYEGYRDWNMVQMALNL